MSCISAGTAITRCFMSGPTKNLQYPILNATGEKLALEMTAKGGGFLNWFAT